MNQSRIETNTQKMIDDYPADYCKLLEATYGDGMMSEGGADAIERMFQDDDISNSKMLDIGCGLGGVAFYLAEQYNADVTGLEINPGMVEEATRRTPPKLQPLVNFLVYAPENGLPFPDDSFDIVYSKGVLVHVEDKTDLFAEIFRVLRPGGKFIVDDWLSPKQGWWGKDLQTMCDIESLTLYADTEDKYQTLLRTAGFIDIKMRDENENYYLANLEVVKRLESLQAAPEQHPIFEKYPLQENIDCYRMVANSMYNNELLVRWFRAVKAS